MSPTWVTKYLVVWSWDYVLEAEAKEASSEIDPLTLHSFKSQIFTEVE